MKQSAPSCERNKDVILAVLKEVLPDMETVLEVGSGTGQHAAYFAAHLPQLVWQPTDLSPNFPSIRAWRAETGLPNLREPLTLVEDRAMPANNRSIWWTKTRKDNVVWGKPRWVMSGELNHV